MKLPRQCDTNHMKSKTKLCTENKRPENNSRVIMFDKES